MDFQNVPFHGMKFLLQVGVHMLLVGVHMLLVGELLLLVGVGPATLISTLTTLF
jgi:hypothetical protein